MSRWVFVLLMLPLFVGLAVGQDRDESSSSGSAAQRDETKPGDNSNRGEDAKRGEIKKPLKDGGAEKKGLRPPKALGPLPAFSDETEAAALKFVGEHHRELASLLKQLKANPKSVGEYRRAIRDLFRTSEKLAQTKAADAERYELELEGWKTDSEIRLLAAKLTMGDEEDLRGKLRKQLARKTDLHIQRLELDKRRAEQRLKKIEESIEKLRREQDQIAERQMSEILGTVRKEKPAKRRAATVSASDKSANDKNEQRGNPRRGAKPAEKTPVEDDQVERIDPATDPEKD